MGSLVDDIVLLKPVSQEASRAYEGVRDEILDYVNRSMLSHPRLLELTGNNPVEIMLDNHKNHFMFMLTVLQLNTYDTLVRTLPWVYRAYSSRGYSYDYFPTHLLFWVQGIRSLISPDPADEIVGVYNFIISHHDEVVCESRKRARGPRDSGEGPWSKVQNSFTVSLLQGQHRRCIELADTLVHSSEDLRDFYLRVVGPSLVAIGEMWERAEISVAEEHLATAIVSRVLAQLYPRFALREPRKGRGIVTCAPNEYHELGGRMLADLLDIEGWDVSFLGANTPIQDLQAMMAITNPFFVGLSVSMPFNLIHTKKLIESVRRVPGCDGIKIIVGGSAFKESPGLADLMGADLYAQDAEAAVCLLGALWEGR